MLYGKYKEKNYIVNKCENYYIVILLNVKVQESGLRSKVPKKTAGLDGNSLVRLGWSE